MAPVEAPRSGSEQHMVSIAPAPAPSPATTNASRQTNGSHLPFTRTTNVGESSRQGSSQSSDRSRSSVSPNRPELLGQSSSSSLANASAHKNPRIKKTVADALATQQGVTPPRKRKRVHYSCAECHRRKHRCDRNIPCQPCLDRGLSDSCRPFQDGDEFGDERDRLKRLEDLVEGLARAHGTLSDDVEAMRKQSGMIRLTETPAKVEPLSNLAEGQGEATTDSESKSYKSSKWSRVLQTPIDLEREELRKGSLLSVDPGHTTAYGGAGEEMLAANNTLEGGLTREGDSFYGALALPSVSRGTIETQIHGERLELSANFPLRSASVKVHRLIQEGGAPPNVIDELMSCLPSRETSDAMLEWYFRDINDTRLPLHERTFRASYEEIMQWKWGGLQVEEGDDGARHIPFLSFLFVILAIAKRSEPEDRCSDEEARKGALFFLHCARRSMAIASAVRADHIDVLLAALFGARLLITLRQSAESWSILGVAIRAAQAIGLHRDGTKLGLDAVTTERRRRLWALIYYLDRTTSMLLGRPQAIDDKVSDCLPPCDVDIDVLPRMGPAPTPEPFPPINPPSTESLQKPPGVYQFIAIRHELAKLTGRVVDHFQDLSKPRNYADVLQIDQDLQQFYSAFPPAYLCQALRGGEANRSFDSICPWLPIHRYLLNLEFHYVRITLHRPYLLRSDRYRQSREAAFASAKADRLIRKEYKEEVKWPSNRARNAHLGGVYRLFSSTLIAGIELLLDPNGSNATELLEMLDDFLNNSGKVADPSQCTKRELAIIKIFKAKAIDPSWCAATATGAKGSKKGQVQSSKQKAGNYNTQSSAALMNLARRNRHQASILPSTDTDTAMSNPLHGQRSDTNELAQSLLDRLGGLETLGTLNQNQSPASSSSNAHELGPSSLGMNIGLVPNFNTIGNDGLFDASASTMLAYNVPNLDGFFDSSITGFESQEGDWASFTNGIPSASSELWNSADGAANGEGTPGQGENSKEDIDNFAGWGTLVEAIVSGQDMNEQQQQPSQAA
ncbi:hypothetical protein CBS101457_001411 [Exobasidium rhododendri]|nr:hypothetical protein CBS101457_001411 [Exobasidium rhododendri]